MWCHTIDWKCASKHAWTPCSMFRKVRASISGSTGSISCRILACYSANWLVPVHLPLQVAPERKIKRGSIRWTWRPKSFGTWHHPAGSNPWTSSSHNWMTKVWKISIYTAMGYFLQEVNLHREAISSDLIHIVVTVKCYRFSTCKSSACTPLVRAP